MLKQQTVKFFLLLMVSILTACKSSDTPDKPNVIIVITDDQGYGDLSCHGNPVLKTPNLDKLYGESVRFTDFHVAPVCTPTRSQLLTGKDAMNNGAFAWAYSREIIHRDVKTMAEIFRENGYATGHFGKWHLGDNYPFRPIDRGFNESIKHGGASVFQTPDYWDNDNYDDHYEHNGEMKAYRGLSTDIWFDESISFAKKTVEKGRPFFIYLPTNVPHSPLIIEKKYSEKYTQPLEEFRGKTGSKLSVEKVSWFFGMLANFDENMGKLDGFLKETGLYENTILIYMTDNGGTAGVPVYNAGMRDSKGSNFEGGHRVPCFIRWPDGNLGRARDIDELTEIQDILPSLVDLCGLKANTSFDGISLAGLLSGQATSLPERTLVVQHATAPVPTKYQSTVMKGKWRLVGGKELYNISEDPHQDTDRAGDHPELASELKEYYESWWARNYPRVEKLTYIPLTSPGDGEVTLTCFDWHGKEGEGNVTVQPDIRMGKKVFGYWNVGVVEEGDYLIKLSRWPSETKAGLRDALPEHKTHTISYPSGVSLPIASASLEIGDFYETSQLRGAGSGESGEEEQFISFLVPLKKGTFRLRGTFLDASGETICGSYYAYIRRIRSD